MKRTITYLLTLLIGIFLLSSAQAQIDVDIKKGEFKKGRKGFRDAWRDVKEGDDYFKMGLSAHRMALKYYQRAYNYNPENPELNYKIGACYLTSINKSRAIQSFEKAMQANPDVAFDVLYLLGKAHQYNYEFDVAIGKYQQFINTAQTDESEDNKVDLAKKRIEECKRAKDFVANPIRVFIDNLGIAINTRFPDYGPVISTDEEVMVFTSRREAPTGFPGATEDRDSISLEGKDPHDFMYFEDLYKSDKDDKGRWSVAQNMRNLNTELHDASIGLSPDGTKMYSYKGTPDGNIYVSELKGNQWTEPEKLKKNINTKYHETSVSLSYDGKRLYFVSNREEDGFGNKSEGGRDIYVSELDGNGEWGPSRNIGRPINSKYDERGVFIHPDGQTMYFSSLGHDNMGDYDIFKARRNSDGSWGRPENIGYPVNTPENDVFFVMAGSGRYGYYSTVKEGGYGFHDIYMITFLGPEKLTVQGTEDNLIASVANPITDQVVEESVEIEKVRLTILKGTVTDAISQAPIEAEIEIVDNENDEVVTTTTSNSKTGKYLVSLPSGKNYGISAKAEDYLFHSENLKIPEATGYQVVIKDIVLTKVGVGSKIVLRNIFFDYDKSTLRSESFPELNRLYKLLESYPKMRIEIGGHTDSHGSLSYNTTLSESRAKSVVDYLINMGLDESRLEYRGYAYTQPIAPNKNPDGSDNPEGRQKNRRTEFKVLSIN